MRRLGIVHNRVASSGGPSQASLSLLLLLNLNYHPSIVTADEPIVCCARETS